jgi:phosphatidylglycerophosphate synthase
MKYSLKDITASLTPEKRRADGYWSRIVLRPLSYPAAWLALRCGLSPNAVTWIGVLFATAGAVLFGWTDGPWPWVGIAGFFIYSVLDCSDGNMARTTREPNPWGEWTDAVGGYIVYTLSLLSLGMAAERIGGPGPAGLCIFLGGFSAAANMLMRAAVQSHRQNALSRAVPHTEAPAEHKPKKENSAEKWISENLGITGIMNPAMCVGLYFRQLTWVLVLYALLYGAGVVWIILKLAVKNSRSGNGEKR